MEAKEKKKKKNDKIIRFRTYPNATYSRTRYIIYIIAVLMTQSGEKKEVLKKRRVPYALSIGSMLLFIWFRFNVYSFECIL